MASSNSTTHYGLSQYVGTDKPTYLVDYNQDMSKIDTGIYGAKIEADENKSSIGTLANLNTTNQDNLVSAINEVNVKSNNIGDLNNLNTTAKNNIVSAVNEVNDKASTVGNLVNLNTTAKNNIVSAVNEVNDKASTIGNLTDLNTTAKNNIVSAVNEVHANVSNFNLTSYNTITKANSGITSENNTITDSSYVTIAKNSDGSLAKIYGEITLNNPTSNPIVIINNTGLIPESDFTINQAGLCRIAESSGYTPASINITVKTNGTIEINKSIGSGKSQVTFWLFPCLYFIKDFGDVPIE